MDLFEIVKTNKIQKKDCTELQSHTYSHLQHSVVGNDISKSCPLSQHHHDWYQSNQFVNSPSLDTSIMVVAVAVGVAEARLALVW